MRLDSKEEMQAQEGCHHDNVAADAQHVAHLVRPQEELVHEPGCCSLDWFLSGATHDETSDCRKNAPTIKTMK